MSHNILQLGYVDDIFFRPLTLLGFYILPHFTLNN